MGKSIKKKKMCELDADDIKKNAEAYMEIASEPRFVCTKCARTSRKDKNLCKASKL